MQVVGTIVYLLETLGPAVCVSMDLVAKGAGVRLVRIFVKGAIQVLLRHNQIVRLTVLVSGVFAILVCQPVLVGWSKAALLEMRAVQRVLGVGLLVRRPVLVLEIVVGTDLVVVPAILGTLAV